jgi:hypothetical protein
MSDTTIDLVRQANPIPSEMAPPPIEEVWRRIDQGAVSDLRDRAAGRSLVRRARPGRPPVFRGRRFSIGGLLTTAMSVLVVAIAVGALVLLGGRRGGPPMASTSGEFATRQQVLQTLGVLRAPPSPAARRAIACARTAPTAPSRAFFACQFSAVPSFFMRPPDMHSNPRARRAAREMAAREGYPRLDTSLLRVVAIPQFDATVTIAPTTWQPSPRSRQRAEGLITALNYSRGQSGTGPEPTSLATVTNHGMWVSDAQATPTMTTVRGAELVPDGVDKVTLEPIRIISAPAPVVARQFGSVSADVHDNVAAFRFPVLTARNSHRASALYGVTVIARATWFDHGKIIKRITTQVYLSITVQGQGPGGVATNP